ncbi:phosphatidate phosphatase LPIN3 isoform X1 [Bufo gargarizans]|uniref:phosphatidate phosphatase LPIN3 isoform X1 n=1 Tax=Bufo gargarizans TaxID=30331 RepID=UPI001CF0FF47|nr:phosphatidate phosphatase LPIN3 isoform X1 [Bufo gargarizans]
MNYVGQLAGSVLGRVRDLYKGVNPATLSGSIDVVVVRQPDGSFRSSPFHVRFGKLGILRSTEMTVDIEVNGDPVDLPMRLGENGEAFFIQDMDENDVPNSSISCPHLPQGTSSLYVGSELTEPSTAFHSPLPFTDTAAKRKNWSRRTITSRAEETSEDKSEDTILLTSDSIYFSFSEIPDDISPSQSTDLLTTAEEDLLQSSTSRSPSPKSDSEVEVRAPGSSLYESRIEWDWGSLPQVSRPDLYSQISQSLPPSPTRELELLSLTSPEPRLPDPEEDCKAGQSVPESGETSTAPFNTDTVNEPPPLHPDDVLSPDSQEVSLYFPNSDPHPPPPPLHNEEDSGQPPEGNTEPSTPFVEMSLCGGLTDKWNIPEDRFLKYKISFSDFSQNPSLVENPRLVLRIHNKFYNWATAAPILLCMQVFNQMLPQGVIDHISQQKMPPQSRGWWFSWRRRSLPNQMQPVTNTKEYVEETEESNTELLNEKIEDDRKPSLVPTQTRPYRKSLRLTSEQIKSLHLKSGANEVVFSICTKFQGTCRTRAQIYLWESTDRIIISDIDGTVTRSDALGHILPQLGKDWTQPGIVQLYNAIHMNDYKFVYCSARSVGLAEITKTFLQSVSEGGFTLPPGPLLLSPTSLFAALHREVIEKAPERFKIACLSDIRQLFTDSYPFYAAFGNRPNDVVAYREVAVSESRIFTVNPRGELTQELNSSFKSSYAALRDLVNVMFPPSSSHSVSALLSQEFSDFSFWKDPLMSLSKEDMEHVS